MEKMDERRLAKRFYQYTPNGRRIRDRPYK
jgi:hypothetical protein